MFLNESGIMIEKWYFELENKFADIKCHEMIVMPNHLHFIIENTGDIASVRANLSVRPDDIEQTHNNIGQTHRSAPTTAPKDEQQIFGEHIGSPLQRVIQWFKTMTTNEYIRGVKNLGWEPFYKKLWQRNYWEHIIRNENSYQNISNYIINNPSKWNEDVLNGEKLKTKSF